VTENVSFQPRSPRLLQTKLMLLQQIGELDGVMQKALQAEDVEALAGVLEQRQELMNQVDQLDVGHPCFAPAPDELTSVHSGTADAEDAEMVARTVEAIRELLQHLSERDAEHMNAAHLLLTRFAVELQELNQSSSASKVYAQQGAGRGEAPVFINRKV